jgi:hypothetical protein
MTAPTKPAQRVYRLTVALPSLGLVRDAQVYHHPRQDLVAAGRTAVSLNPHPTKDSSFFPAFAHQIEEIKR